MNVVWTVVLGILGVIAFGLLLPPQIVYWQIKHIKKSTTMGM